MSKNKTLEEKAKQLEEICNNYGFELMTPYINANSPVIVKHKKCNKEITYKQADTILRKGYPICKCEKHSRKYTQESFEKKIHDICPDLKVLSPYTVSYEKVKFLYIPDGVEFEATPQAIYIKEGYPFNIADNTQIIKGINDMWSTRPDIAQYLVNKEDGYKYKYGTTKALDFRCPNCGTIVHYSPRDLFDVFGSIKCPHCRDGISYPEKLMISILSSLGIKFIWQYTKNRGGGEWCGKYKYDFYLCDFNIIIEVHGIQHYEETFVQCPLINIQQNDIVKRDLAIQNGINDYIVIDARESEIEWIKNSLYQSKLSNIINLDDVNWNQCNIDATKSYIIEIGKDWDKGDTLDDLANKYQINKHTVRNHLKKCEQLGLLNRSYLNQVRKLKKKVQCVETGQVFNSIKDAQDFCNPNVAGGSRIGVVLNISDKTAYGYHWMEYAI